MAFTSSFSSLRYMNTVGAVSPAVPFTNVTIAGWWRLTNLALASELVETNDATAVSNLNAAIFMNGSQVAWSITNAAGTRVSINPASGFMVVNTWTHLGLTWDGTTIRAYVNGALVASTAGPAGPFPNWSDLQIGPAEGQIQDAVFFDAKLSDAEMAALFAKRMPTQQRANLQLHIPIFTGSSTDWGKDYSGKGRNFSNVNTPTDGTSVPPAGWGDDGTQVILLPDGDISIDGSGTTQTTGTAALTAAAGLVASGLTQTTGAASLTAAASLVASGLTQTTGSATMSSAAALVASGLTRTTGAATFGTATFPAIATGLTQTTGSAAMTAAAGLVASGLTQTTGAATMTAAAALVASGLTQTNGSAQFTGSLLATGTTQTTGAAALTAAAALAASGLTQTTGAATLTAAAALVASGLTRTTGTAAVTAAATLAASGLTQTTGTATMTASAALVASGLTQTTGTAALASTATLTASGLTQTTGVASFGTASFPLIAAGLTQTTGVATLTTVLPPIVSPQALIRAPRETIWITSNPLQPPTEYVSVLGSKLRALLRAPSGVNGNDLLASSWKDEITGTVISRNAGTPALIQDGSNFAGKPVLRTTDGPNRFDRTFANPVLPGGGGGEVFGVIRVVSMPGPGSLMFGVFSATGTAAIGLEAGSNVLVVRYSGGSSSVAFTDLVGVHFFSGRIDVGTNLVTLNLDGVDVAQTGVGVGPLAGDRFRLIVGSSGFSFDGFSALYGVVQSPMSTAERADVLRIARQEYGF